MFRLSSTSPSPPPAAASNTPRKEATCPVSTASSPRWNKQSSLAAEIANLERKIKTARPAPPLTQRAWTVGVRFTRNGSLYTYLILRHGGKFYTTGTNVQDSVFNNWDDLLVWLDSVKEHSALIPMSPNTAAPVALEGRQA